MRGASGLGDGFDFYEDRLVAPTGTDAAGSVQRRGDETGALALSWLAGMKSRPFFLYVEGVKRELHDIVQDPKELRELLG